MKKSKILVIIISILLICCLSIFLVACGGNDSSDNNNNGGDNNIEKPDVKPVEPPVTGDEIASKLHNFINANEQNYDFKVHLSGNLSAMGLGGTANGYYNAKYRFNNTTNDLKFKRTTSGLLFYDSTCSIFPVGDKKMKVKQNEDNVIKKVSLSENEDNSIELINLPFVSLISACNGIHFKNIEAVKGVSYQYKATINAQTSNEQINKILSSIAKMDSKFNIKDISITNLAAIPFYFNYKDGDSEISDYKFEFNIEFPFKSVKIALNISYEQNKNSADIEMPNISNYIIEKNDIQKELSIINNAFNTLEEKETYSLDLTAKNDFDPGWNHLATVDQFISRMYKNASDFNNSYEYKTHHEEDGKENYKYTLGNIQDGSVHLVSRKGKNVVSPSNKTMKTQFDYLTTAFKYNVADVDCIKKEIVNGKTVYSIFLSRNNTVAVKDKICDMINSNEAEGIIKVDNYFNKDAYEIDNADVTFELVGGNLDNITIDTKLHYVAIGGDYMGSKITLKNSLLLDIDKKLKDASKYEAPEKAEGSILGLENFKYYIL